MKLSPNILFGLGILFLILAGVSANYDKSQTSVFQYLLLLGVLSFPASIATRLYIGARLRGRKNRPQALGSNVEMQNRAVMGAMAILLVIMVVIFVSGALPGPNYQAPSSSKYYINQSLSYIFMPGSDHVDASVVVDSNVSGGLTGIVVTSASIAGLSASGLSISKNTGQSMYVLLSVNTTQQIYSGVVYLTMSNGVSISSMLSSS